MESRTFKLQNKGHLSWVRTEICPDYQVSGLTLSISLKDTVSPTAFTNTMKHVSVILCLTTQHKFYIRFTSAIDESQDFNLQFRFINNITKSDSLS